MKSIMKNGKKPRRFSAVLALILILLAACAPLAKAESGVYSPRKEYEYLVGATTWQLSAESQAMMRQAFNAAQGQIAKAVMNCLLSDQPDWRFDEDATSGKKIMLHNGKRAAIICDIDDTLVDGAHYTANIVGSDGDYNNAAFARFVLSDGCAALPGAVAFANFCADWGVEVYYVTNRYDQGYKIGQSDSAGAYPAEGGGLYVGRDGKEIGTTLYQAMGKSFYDITLERMLELGFPIDDQHLILHDGKVCGGTKEAARTAIREGAAAYPNGQRADGNSTGTALTIALEPHEVLLLLGDQLSDFTDDFDAEGLNALSRAVKTGEYADKFGTEWILLPNAVYGKAFDYATAYGLNELLRAADYTKAP